MIKIIGNIPIEIKREIYLFLSIEDILEQNINDTELWSLLLKRDYNILNFIQPKGIYMEKYNELYKETEDIYKEILNYIIEILLKKYVNGNGNLTVKDPGIEKNYYNILYSYYSEIEQIFRAELYVKNYINDKEESKNMIYEKKKEYIDIYGKFLRLYKRKILENDDENVLFLDNRLTEVSFNYLLNVINITNIKGITLYDIIKGIYSIKQENSNKNHAMRIEIKNVEIIECKSCKKKMIIEIEFYPKYVWNGMWYELIKY